MKKAVLGLLVSAALLTGCASSNTVTADKYSGFLDDYELLKPVADNSGRLGYQTPGADWQKYNNIIIDEVVVMAPDEDKELYSKLMADMAVKYQAFFKQNLSKSFNIVDTTGPDTLRLQASISRVFASYDDMKGYQYIPVAAIFTGAKRASGAEEKRARVMTEVRIVDSSDGKLLSQAVDLKYGENKLEGDSSVSISDVAPILEQWAQTTTDILAGLKTGAK